MTRFAHPDLLCHFTCSHPNESVRNHDYNYWNDESSHHPDQLQTGSWQSKALMNEKAFTRFKGLAKT